MKAILLAAGRGERLRPLTDEIPKVLVPLAGRPLLDYWLEICENGGVTDVLVNGHYLADKVEAFLDKARNRYHTNIHFVLEEKLYGTGGTLRNNADFVSGEPFFFWCHADNFTNLDLTEFIQFHREGDVRLSVALFKTNVPKQCGIAEQIDSDGRILKFVEKPENPTGDLASAAMFVMSPDVIDQFPSNNVIDFSKEILPKFAGDMRGYRLPGFNVDVGTMENYSKADQLAENVKTGSEP